MKSTFEWCFPFQPATTCEQEAAKDAQKEADRTATSVAPVVAVQQAEERDKPLTLREILMNDD